MYKKIFLFFIIILFSSNCFSQYELNNIKVDNNYSVITPTLQNIKNLLLSDQYEFEIYMDKYNYVKNQEGTYMPGPFYFVITKNTGSLLMSYLPTYGYDIKTSYFSHILKEEFKKNNINPVFSDNREWYYFKYDNHKFKIGIKEENNHSTIYSYLLQ